MSVIITTLDKKPSLSDEALSLIESSLGYHSPESFVVDFAPLIKNNLQNLYVALKNGKVVGHVGLLIRNLSVNALQSGPIAFLGGICVQQDFRGQGILRALLNAVFHDWDKRVSLYMLWGDKVDIYRKFNFYLAGGIIQSRTQESPLSKNWTRTKLQDISESDLKQVKRIYQQFLASRYSTIVRKDEDWETIKAITSADIFIRRNKKGTLEAYFFKGKGADLSNIIYEIGLSSHLIPEDIIQEIAGPSIWMPQDWKIYFDQPELHFLAFFRMASAQKLTSLVSTWSRGKIKITRIKNNFIYYQFSKKQYRSSFQEFISLIWGPSPLSEFQSLGPPLFISGLDSI